MARRPHLYHPPDEDDGSIDGSFLDGVGDVIVFGILAVCGVTIAALIWFVADVFLS